MLSPSFVLTSLAQVAVLAAVTGAVLAVAGRGLPQVRLAAWRGMLAATWLLPVTALLPPDSADGSTTALATALGGFRVTDDRGLAAGAAASVDWTAWTTAALAVLVAARLVVLGVGLWRLRQTARGLPAAACPLFEQVRRRFDVAARLVWHPTAAQPFTFGARPSMVVIPAALAAAPAQTRRAVYAHELVHAARRDWRWMLVEELAAAPLWFHPAIWAARRELQQAREEIVDRATVRETGMRRHYAELLLTLAGQRPVPSPVCLPMFTTRQLARRLAALVSEPAHSRPRLLASSLAVSVACLSSLAVTVQALPLPPVGWLTAGTVRQPVSKDPGPLERVARVAPGDMAPPPRVAYVAPAVPASVGDLGNVDMTLRLVLDAGGGVVEARATDVRTTAADPRRTEALGRALIDAVLGWRFAAPAAAPVAMTAHVTLVPASKDGLTVYSLRERPVPLALKPAEYPDADEQAGTEGTAEVEVTVDPAGRVSATRLVRATTPGMGDAAIAAMQASKFYPGMKDGTPVPVVVTITVRFALR